jgi:hypothetical protein
MNFGFSGLDLVGHMETHTSVGRSVKNLIDPAKGEPMAQACANSFYANCRASGQ